MKKFFVLLLTLCLLLPALACADAMHDAIVQVIQAALEPTDTYAFFCEYDEDSNCFVIYYDYDGAGEVSQSAAPAEWNQMIEAIKMMGSQFSSITDTGVLNGAHFNVILVDSHKSGPASSLEELNKTGFEKLLVVEDGEVIFDVTNDGANDSVPVTDDSAKNPPEASAASIENEIRTVLADSVPYSSVLVTDSVTGSGNGFAVFIDLSSTADITYFGEYIVRLRNVCEPLVEKKQVDHYMMLLTNRKGEKDFAYSSIGYPFGYLADYRSGEVKGTPLYSIDDLTAVFSQLLVSGLLSDVSEEDLKIYNEVWSALDAEPNKSSDEIYAEISNNYGMTPEELKKFMWDTMEKIY